MPRRPVVLGWPVSLLMRGVTSIAPTIAGAIPAAAHSIAGITAATGVIMAAAPWITSALKSDASETIPTGGAATQNAISDLGRLTDFVGGILTFMDMNAQVVTISERRRMAVVSIPGRESDFLQDLGGHTVKYNIRGKFFDYDPQAFTRRGIMQTLLKITFDNASVGSTQMLRLIMRTSTPVPFITEHEISFALITNFSFTQTGGAPEWVDYDMSLLEYERIPYLAKMAILGVGNLVSNLVEG